MLPLKYSYRMMFRRNMRMAAPSHCLLPSRFLQQSVRSKEKCIRDAYLVGNVERSAGLHMYYITSTIVQ